MPAVHIHSSTASHPHSFIHFQPSTSIHPLPAIHSCARHLITTKRNLYGAVDGRIVDADGVSEGEEEEREPNDQNDREEKKTAEAVLDDRLTLRPPRGRVRLKDGDREIGGR